MADHRTFWSDSRRRAALRRLTATYDLRQREQVYLREAILEEEHEDPPASDALRAKLDHLARTVRVYFERGCRQHDPSHNDFLRALKDEQRQRRFRAARPRPRHLPQAIHA